MKILIIEDNQIVVDSLKQILTEDIIITALTIEEGEQYVQSCDLILLDLQLPDGFGLDLLKKVRLVSNVPIIVLTVVDDENIVTNALDLGADDYITKPFSVNILKARINNVIRRSYGMNGKNLQIGALQINLPQQKVYKNGVLLDLTRNEMNIFIALVKANGKILTRRYLIETYLDHDDNYVGDNALTVNIQRLKKKVGKEYIHTKRGIGYYFGEKVYEEKI